MKTNKKFRPTKVLKVYYKDEVVGILAYAKNKKVAFEYDDEWIKNGFSISPYSLPLKKKVFFPPNWTFDGLFGVFADSLPDEWGNTLVNRILEKQGIEVENLNPLDKLLLVGNSGMGALAYRSEKKKTPEEAALPFEDEVDLDKLAEECDKILGAEEIENVEEIYKLSRHIGGERPKISMRDEETEWIVKFYGNGDTKDSGREEYDYFLCARSCGINMTEKRLFASEEGKGYFGIERFDRTFYRGKIEKCHVITAAALLEADYKVQSIDYHDLMKLTIKLTENNMEDVEDMFKRMCFNVYAHNRNDHAKNFTFIYNEQEGKWNLSPAYDLTYSRSEFGGHTTTVNGNAAEPTDEDILKVGRDAGLPLETCEDIMEEVRSCVQRMLGKFLEGGE